MITEKVSPLPPPQASLQAGSFAKNTYQVFFNARPHKGGLIKSPSGVPKAFGIGASLRPLLKLCVPIAIGICG